MGFAALWVVGHFQTLPHSHGYLPSQLLGLHSFHFIRSRVFCLQGVTYNREQNQYPSPGSKHLDFVFLTYHTFILLWDSCRFLLAICPALNNLSLKVATYFRTLIFSGSSTSHFSFNNNSGAIVTWCEDHFLN